MMGVFKDPRWTNALIIFNGFYSDVSTYRNPSFFLLVNMLKRVSTLGSLKTPIMQN